MVQKSVYTAQALGVPGEFYDDSPRRVAPYILRSAAGEIAAAGSIAFAGPPAPIIMPAPPRRTLPPPPPLPALR